MTPNLRIMILDGSPLLSLIKNSCLEGKGPTAQLKRRSGGGATLEAAAAAKFVFGIISLILHLPKMVVLGISTTSTSTTWATENSRFHWTAVVIAAGAANFSSQRSLGNKMMMVCQPMPLIKSTSSWFVSRGPPPLLLTARRFPKKILRAFFHYLVNHSPFL